MGQKTASLIEPAITWRYDKARLKKTAAIVFAMALLFGVFSLGHWFGAVLALIAVSAGVHTLILARGDKPVLTIGPDGLFFARFSSRTVPWSEITEVAVVRGVQRGVAWGKTYTRSSPQMDEISFALRNYDDYSGALRNALRGLHTAFGLPGVRCNVWNLENAPVDDVARAIAAHWPGAIKDMIPRNGRFHATPWTGMPPAIS